MSIALGIYKRKEEYLRYWAYRSTVELGEEICLGSRQYNDQQEPVYEYVKGYLI
jgi:hypothetical protein